MIENQSHTQAAKISFPVEEDWGGVTDAREAFCIAVNFYRSGD